MALQTWIPLSADNRIRGLKYSFGSGRANTMAVQLDDGSWLVVSPSVGSEPAIPDSLAADGGVSALLAPNSNHHLGQPSWRARFPAAVSYAPEGSLSRLASKAPGIEFRPLAELVAKLPSSVSVFVPDGLKLAESVVRATSGADTVFYTGDLLSNTTEEDLPAVARFLLAPFGGGTGYRYNKVAALLYVKERASYTRAVRAAFEATPATAVYPAHGDAVRDDAMGRTRAALA